MGLFSRWRHRSASTTPPVTPVETTNPRRPEVTPNEEAHRAHQGSQSGEKHSRGVTMTTNTRHRRQSGAAGVRSRSSDPHAEIAKGIFALARKTAARLGSHGSGPQRIGGETGWCLESGGWYFANRHPYLERHREWWLTDKGVLKIHEFDLIMGRVENVNVRRARIGDLLQLDYAPVHQDVKPPATLLRRTPPTWRQVPNDGSGIRRKLESLKPAPVRGGPS